MHPVFWSQGSRRTGSHKVPDLDLVLQRFLAPVYCLGVPRLGCTQNRRGPGSGLLPQMSQTHAQTLRGSRFLPIPFDVPDQCPDPQRSLVPAYSLEGPNSCPDRQRSWLSHSSWEVLDPCQDPQGSCLRSTPLKVPDSCLDPWWSLALAHLLSHYSPVPVLVETAASGSGS